MLSCSYRFYRLSSIIGISFLWLKELLVAAHVKSLGLLLGLNVETIDSDLYNHRNDEIVCAANKLLSKWLLRYEDRKVACGDLISALRKCGLQALIPEVFEEEYKAFQKQEVSSSEETVPETSATFSGMSSAELEKVIPIADDLDIDISDFVIC